MASPLIFVDGVLILFSLMWHVGSLNIKDKKVGEGRISKTIPFIFSADETLDAGGLQAVNR